MKFSVLICLMLVFPFCTKAQKFYWGKTWGGLYCNWDAAVDVATDGLGNTYAVSVVGDNRLKADTFLSASSNVRGIFSYPESSGPSALLLSSYTCAGAMRWARLVECKGQMSCSGITQSGSNVYIVGSFLDTPKKFHTRYFADSAFIDTKYAHYFLACLDTLGHTRWIRFVGSDNASTDVLPDDTVACQYQAITINGSGNVQHYVQLPSGIQLAPGIFSSKGIYRLDYSPSGVLLNTVRFNLPSDYEFGRGGGTLNKFAINKRSGTVFGVFTRFYVHPVTNIGTVFYYLCALASNGNLLWKDSLKGADYFNGVEYGALNSVAYDGANGVYVSLMSQDAKSFELGGLKASYPSYQAPMVGVLKLDTLGKGIWISTSDAIMSKIKIGGTSLLSTGEIVSVGTIAGILYTATDTSYTPTFDYSIPIVINTSRDGKKTKYYTPPKYKNMYGRPVANRSGFTAISIDHADNFYIGGYQQHDTIYYDSFLSIGLRVDSSYMSGGLFIRAQESILLRYGVDCKCPHRAKASFKESLVQEKDAVFTYTGTTDWVDSVVWSFGDGSRKVMRSGFTVPFHHYYASHHDYTHDTVWVKTYGPCGFDSFYRYPLALAVASIGEPKTWVVYPNPVHSGGDLELSFEGSNRPGTAELSIRDLSGRHVFAQALEGSSATRVNRIVIPDLAPGMYLLVIRTPESSVVQKLVVE